ncbi:hypothetical protein L840_0169 [Mycobacterium sp. MAC_011194_8550]|nr:hypothetical protein L840_0169 [Mycobacterium sp. MAC_011194_8550]
MIATNCNNTRTVQTRPAEPTPPPQAADNLALLLTARRRRHMHRTAW